MLAFAYYTMDDIETDFILDAIEFVAEQGHNFLALYDFDMSTGAWLHKADSGCMEGFSLQAALECGGYQCRSLSTGERTLLYSAFLNEARTLAQDLSKEQPQLSQHQDAEVEALKFFSVPQASIAR